MPKKKKLNRGITGDPMRRRRRIRRREEYAAKKVKEAQLAEERRANETEEEKNCRLEKTQRRIITENDLRKRELAAIRQRAARAAESKEKRKLRLLADVKRARERRANETEDERKRRLSLDAKRSKQRYQKSCAARAALHKEKSGEKMNVIEEVNCRKVRKPSKVNRGIAGDAMRKRRAIRRRERYAAKKEKEAQLALERRANETEEEKNCQLEKTQQGITENALHKRERAAIRQREKRAVESEEKRKLRLLADAKRARERRANETEEERNRRLSLAKRSRQRRQKIYAARAKKEKEAQLAQERRANETEEEKNCQLEKTQQGITENALHERAAIRQREKRAAESEEKKQLHLLAEAKRAQERRANETEEERNRRLSFIAKHTKQRRQKIYAARAALHKEKSGEKINVIEEVNCRKMRNLFVKCGVLYEGPQKTRDIYTHYCHNGKVIEKAFSLYPLEMKPLIDCNSTLSSSSMNTQTVPSTKTAAYCTKFHGQIYHRSDEKFAWLYRQDIVDSAENVDEPDPNSEYLDDDVDRKNFTLDQTIVVDQFVVEAPVADELNEYVDGTNSVDSHVILIKEEPITTSENEAENSHELLPYDS